MEEQDVNLENEENELSHSDKMVGVITEPSVIFKKISNWPPKTGDWLIPLLVVILIAIASNFILLSNPVLKDKIMQKQMERVEQNLQDAVKKGQISKEQAQQRMDMIQDQINAAATTRMIISGISIIVISFIMFFVVSGFFYLFFKIFFKAEGNYKASLSAYGLPQYIIALQVIVMIIVMLLTQNPISGLSLGALFGEDKKTFAGFIMSKADPFSIWFYAVISIAYARIFKSSNTGKYFAAVFGIWIGVSIIFFFAAKYITFLQWFIQ